MKATIVNGIMIVISLALALVLSEVVVRAFGLAPEVVFVEKWRVRLSDNPRIGYEPIPNLDSSGKSAQFYSYIGRSNSMGFRDYDHPRTRPAGSQRVVVLGDSVTAGLWVNEDEKIFTSVMEKTLQGRGMNVDVMNFGVSGYNTSQEVETLKEKALPFAPDLVIVAYCLNDRFQDDGNIYGILLAEERKSQAGGRINTATVSWMARHSALVRFIRYRVLAPEKVIKNDRAEVKQFYADTVEDSFAELAALSRQHGFQVLVAVFPNFGEKDRGLSGTYAQADEHAAIARLSQQQGFEYVDMLSGFRQCKRQAPRNSTISYDRYHPNVLGNQCAGLILAQATEKLLR